MKKSQKSATSRNKTSIDDIVEYYRELIKEYSQPTDDELILKLQTLDITSRNLMILYIASEYKYGITARIIGTNIAYCKKLIEQIRQKIIETEI